jgi:release factor glutamine methyltransferase
VVKSVTQLLNWGRDYLEKHRVEDPSLSTKVLLSFATKIPKIDFIKNPEAEIPVGQIEHFQKLVEKRAEGIPIAYLIHEKEFYSRPFYVNESVLIPRPETEILIEWFEKKIGNQSVKVCDVGTGSGAIAVTLKKNFPDLSVTAVDISPDALQVARMNAEMHRVDIDFVESNLLENVQGPFDVIVANLPYVPSGDIPGLSREVQCEPVLALDSGRDGLDHYGKLVPQLKEKLVSGGDVFFEYGIHQTPEMISLLKHHSFTNIEVRKDFAGIDRIISATKS